MEVKNFINFNGNLVPSDQPVLQAGNRSFRYGDGLFETIRLMRGEVLFFEEHLRRIKKGMHLLGMESRDDFTFHNLYLLIRHLEQMNDLKGNGRIRMSIFRNEGGLYMPHSNQVSFLLEADPVSTEEYVFNENPLRIEVFTEIAKPKNKFSNIKTSNALLYVMAGIHKQKLGLDECILINDAGRICETIGSNIFVVSNDVIFTPALAEACIEGIMRGKIIDLLRLKGKKIEEGSISIEQVMNADGIFLTNVIEGIKWVGSFRQKRYFNTVSKWLFSELNEALIKKV